MHICELPTNIVNDSFHDTRIFRRSEYHAANIDNDVLFPGNTFLLGDSTYPS